MQSISFVLEKSLSKEAFWPQPLEHEKRGRRLISVLRRHMYPSLGENPKPITWHWQSRQLILVRACVNTGQELIRFYCRVQYLRTSVGPKLLY